ncbi:hypothetical protein QA634_15840 [Methylobacterium sp. CB376]|uniref:hypothetical protein n=1 Tax=Methylobacterium sp. CB376 TaxID=3138063 RepID=UPI0012373002|nr:hypothetical protein [Methylobacterium nodulans]WFT83213.1 hypothetical protein QA634_15840 [Methylobacterium nodulans]
MQIAEGAQGSGNCGPSRGSGAGEDPGIQIIRHPIDCFAISDFGHADVGFAQAPRSGAAQARDPGPASIRRIPDQSRAAPVPASRLDGPSLVNYWYDQRHITMRRDGNCSPQ